MKPISNTMDNNLIESFVNYYDERRKLVNIGGWIGGSTASDILKPVYLALRAIKLNLLQLLNKNNNRWILQMSIGQGAATPDHYIAILPPKQKVSNGIYFCICFDRNGTGCVMGAMTSLFTPQHVDIPPVVRAEQFSNPSTHSKDWRMLPPNTVNVWSRNNAFFNPVEFTCEYMLNQSDTIKMEITSHIDRSLQMVQDIIDKKNTRR